MMNSKSLFTALAIISVSNISNVISVVDRFYGLFN